MNKEDTLAYVGAHPGQSAKQISEALMLALWIVKHHLSTLVSRGQVRRAARRYGTICYWAC